MTLPMQQNQQPETMNIDGVDYRIADFTPEIRGTLALMDAARQQTQTAQIELAMKQAAHAQFGAQLREQLRGLKPVSAPPVVTPGRAVKKSPARRPANQKPKTGTRRKK